MELLDQLGTVICGLRLCYGKKWMEYAFAQATDDTAKFWTTLAIYASTADATKRALAVALARTIIDKELIDEFWKALSLIQNMNNAEWQ